MAKQKQFGFRSRGEQLALLRKFHKALETPEAIKSLKEGSVSPRSTVAVLRAIDDHSNSESGWCWASQCTVAGELCLNVRTVRRTVAWLENVGLITVWRQGKMQPNRTKIVWVNVASAINGDFFMPTSNVENPSLQCQQVRGHGDQVRGHGAQVRGHGAQSERTRVSSNPIRNGLDPVMNRSVGQEILEEVELPDLDLAELCADAKAFRKACRCGPATIPSELIWEAVHVAKLANWSALDVAKRIGKGGIRSPGKYLEGAIRNARQASGLQEFKYVELPKQSQVLPQKQRPSNRQGTSSEPTHLSPCEIKLESSFGRILDEMDERELDSFARLHLNRIEMRGFSDFPEVYRLKLLEALSKDRQM